MVYISHYFKGLTIVGTTSNCKVVGSSLFSLSNQKKLATARRDKMQHEKVFKAQTFRALAFRKLEDSLWRRVKARNVALWISYDG